MVIENGESRSERWRVLHNACRLAALSCAIVAASSLLGCGQVPPPPGGDVGGFFPDLPPADPGPAQPGSPNGSDDENGDGNGAAPIDFTGSFTSPWTQQMVRQMVRDETNTMPFITPPPDKIMPGYWVWDSWPVLLRDGSIATINGHYVIIALAVPETVLPPQRHDVARWRYLYSSDGRDWIDGGDVFPPGSALGSRQWSGSTIYDPETDVLTCFYTATGDAGEQAILDPPHAADPPAGNGDHGPNGDSGNGLPDDFDEIDDTPFGGIYGPDFGGPTPGVTYRQEMVQVSATVTDQPAPVSFVDWGEHRIFIEPDLFWYEESEGFIAGVVFAWRDPYYFRDPRSGRSFVTFTARTANTRFTGWNGCIGLAVADDEALSSWTLLPPLIDALEVNNELERSHHLYIDGRYYLFFSSGGLFRFDPQLSDVPAAESAGLYGFVADELQGPYVPLNGTGLVLANPPAAPAQGYSFQVLPGGYVIFFIDFYRTGTAGFPRFQDDLDEAWFEERFGGTLAPLVQIGIEGDQTRLLGWPATSRLELVDPPPQAQP